ncbi:hypothetical protein [Clostridium intestinale]|uniref:YkgJ family cysteine cluster protein n=1 Tax=Clostridium intestinale TaxID=36845 RepID=UPI0028E22B7B|nr:hypothetical protein [Clostridium intestinale]
MEGLLVVNKFNECDMCGECCKTPCDLIPEDLELLMNKFDLSLKELFEKYLIVLPTVCGEKSDIIFRMVPVKVNKINNKRINKDFVDNDYMTIQGKCIFNNDNNMCTINDIKPLGGKMLICSKMTGSSNVQLKDSGYFAHWYNNQHLFKDFIPDYSKLEEARKLYTKANEEHVNNSESRLYFELRKRAELIIKEVIKEFNTAND